MKMFLLSDNSDTWEGMRLAGVDGVILHSHQKEEIEAKIKELIKSDDTGIILITEKLRILCQDYIDNIMLKYKKPLFLEIPDRHGFGRSKTSITDYIKKSIGLKL
ncbi:MAG: V-type ATP synthase subunit F [Oscillospiraceae bacterium]|nr:V-type ATP synthase subunit F [Oscillospiraceae bacterium]